MSDVLVTQMAIEITDATRLGQQVSFVLQPANMLQLCGQLQLALRHPGNTGGAAAFARSFVDVCTQWFRDRGHVACVTVLERGDDPTFDMASAFEAAKVRERVDVLRTCVRLLPAPTPPEAPELPPDRWDTYETLAQDIREARGDLIEAFDRFERALEQLEALR